MGVQRPCLGSPVRPRCARYVTPPASRCDECRNATRRERRHAGYDDPRYRRRRGGVKARICQRCRVTNAETVHHMDGDPSNNNDKNLVDACAACARVLDKEMRARRKRARGV